MMMTLAGILFPLCVLLSCVDADPEVERMAYLHNHLIEDNHILFERDPELLAGKFRKMTVTPFLFLRGTARLFVHDVLEPTSPAFMPTAYGTFAGSRILCTGDAHPENFGTYLAGNGDLLVDFNDFDTANWGPWWVEVRRLAVGWHVAGHMLETQADAPENTTLRLAREAIRGYLHEIRNLEAGGDPVSVVEGGDNGPIFFDLIRRARRDGDILEELDDFTRLDDDTNVRSIFLGQVKPGEAEGIHGSALAEISYEEHRMIAGLIDRYRHTLHDPSAFTPEMFRIKGAARRLGAGVGSYPILRYYVLLEGPTDSPDDDWVIDMKEGVPAMVFPGHSLFPRRSFDDPAERVVRMTRAFHVHPDNDALVGWATDGDLSFHFQSRTKYQKNLDVERMVTRLQEGRWSVEDMQRTAFLTGRILARGHATAPTLDGPPGLGAITQALRNDDAGFERETLRFAARYAPTVPRDMERLIALLEQRGPLLGYRPSPAPR